jgi:Immunoglobulin-like domain of bacterial spore germination/Sporulation and spore germination
MKRALSVLLAALLVAGCGEGDSTGTGTGDETTTGHEVTPITVYFLRDDQVWPVRREVHAPGSEAAMDELLAGPGDAESELDLTTAVPEEGAETSVAGDVATVESEAELSDPARAQIVYTLTADPAVTSVEIEGQPYTRADFEEQTPSVLVESPLAGTAVSSPLEARGTANTFEATFSFEIRDSSGEVIAADFGTATSGSGTRGTFSFAQPFVVEEDQEGTLVVFELSAEDGSRMHEVEIPLSLQE